MSVHVESCTKWILYPPPFGNKLQEGDLVFIRTKSKKEIGRKGTIIEKEKSNHNKNETEKLIVKIPITKSKTGNHLNDNHQSFYTASVRTNRLVAVWDTSKKSKNGGTIILLTKTTNKYRLLAASQLRKDDHILEIGCSNGECSLVIAKYGGSLVGIDVSTEMIAQAKEKMPDYDSLESKKDVQFHVIDPFTQPQKVIQLSQKQQQQQQSKTDTDPTVIFIDIGGNRDLISVVKMLAWVKRSFSPRLIIVKSEEMVQALEEGCDSSSLQTIQKTKDIDDDTSGHNNKRFKSSTSGLQLESCGTILNGDEWFDTLVAKSSLENSVMKKKLPHPQKAPLQVCPNDESTPICRYHNYHINGCYHHREGKCPYDHNYCHWCLKKGHTALQCPNP